MPRLVAITGASGLVGGNLAAALEQRGYRVRAIRRAGSKIGHLRHLRCDWCEAELNDHDSFCRAFDGVDAVFHCAGSTVQSRLERPEHQTSNVLSAQRAVSACLAAKVNRLVFCSSIVTCGLASGETIADETTGGGAPPPAFADGYRTSKIAAERAVLEASDALDLVVVNPGYVFGPLDAKPSSGRLILHLANYRLLWWTAGWNNFVDARDVASGMVAALEKGRRGERYILGGENLSYRAVMSLVARELGQREPRFPLPRVLAALGGGAGDLIERVSGKPQDVNSATVRYAYCPDLRFSSAKAMRELGYAPRPVRQAIRDAIAWFRAAGILNDRR